MLSGLIGQRARAGLARVGVASLGIVLAIGLSACTTVEGTNAMTDIGTFEREVLKPTAAGVGLIPGAAEKDEPTTARAPLVLPASGQGLPPTTQVAAAQLPANSDTVRIDTTGLTEADLQRLRNAKVVDLRSLSGRPLTEAEAKMLTARMQAANMTVSNTSTRPLYLPPDEYFTRVGDAELVCRTPNGELVSVNDQRCPEDVRKALRAQRTWLGSGGGASAPIESGSLGKELGLDKPN